MALYLYPQEALKVTDSRGQTSEDSTSQYNVHSGGPRAQSMNGTVESLIPPSQLHIITEASYHAYKLPLRLDLTSDASKQHREGLVLRLSIGMTTDEKDVDSKHISSVYGEVAPLSGIRPKPSLS